MANQSYSKPGQKATFKVQNTYKFYKNDQIKLTANIGSFQGERPGVSFAKYWKNPKIGDWMESTRRF